MKPDWYYDDLKQVGLDFADEAQVASYDDRQQEDVKKARQLLEELNLGAGASYADLGCGTGLLAVEAAKLGAEVTAIDVSQAMLKAVEAHAAKAGVRVVTVNAGFLSLPENLGAFDLISSCFAFHHLPDFWKAEALVRLKAKLKPGGRVFLRDVVFACPPAQIEATVEDWARYISENTGYARDEVATHVREEHSTFDWILEGMIERAGYRLLRCERTPPVYADYLCEVVA